MNKAKYYKIGLFTIAGLALIITMTIVLGAGTLFKKNVDIETYFGESVQGLAEGAPVKYRGVPIGIVIQIGLCSSEYGRSAENKKPFNRYVYLKIAIDPKKFPQIKNYRTLIEQGMRIQLASQGITGLMYIEANYHSPQKLANDTVKLPWEPKLPYIPSVPSTLTTVSDSLLTILSNIKNIDYAGISRNLDSLLLSADKLLNTMNTAIKKVHIEELRADIKVLVKDVNTAINTIDSVAKRVREILVKEEFDQVPKDISTIISNVRKSSNELRPMVKKISTKTAETIESLNTLAQNVNTVVTRDEVIKTIKVLPQLATQLKSILKRLHLLVTANQQNINTTVRNIRLMSENLKQFSSNVRKFPSQVLFGEPPRHSNQRK